MILNRLSVLSHAQRMAIFRLLVRRYPDALPAGQIGDVLTIKPSTLSVYLSALKAAELVEQERKGTSLLYRASIPAVQGVMDFLLMDCCKGRPDMCATSPTTLPTDRKLNAIFICTANSARSIFAEAILRHEAGDKFNVYSAGTNPAAGLNPVALDMLKDKGIDTSNLESHGLEVYQSSEAPDMDFVFTVCDMAANEECPAWTGQPISAHWSIPDPVKSTGTDAEQKLAFQNAYGMLRNRILSFSALPFDTLDCASLQNRVDEISKEASDQ